MYTYGVRTQQLVNYLVRDFRREPRSCWHRHCDSLEVAEQPRSSLPLRSYNSLVGLDWRILVYPPTVLLYRYLCSFCVVYVNKHALPLGVRCSLNAMRTIESWLRQLRLVQEPRATTVCTGANFSSNVHAKLSLDFTATVVVP